MMIQVSVNKKEVQTMSWVMGHNRTNIILINIIFKIFRLFKSWFTEAFCSDWFLIASAINFAFQYFLHYGHASYLFLH